MFEKKDHISDECKREHYSSPQQMPEHTRTEQLAHFTLLTAKVIKNLKEANFVEKYSPNAATLARLFDYTDPSKNIASLNSKEITQLATDFYKFCKSNRTQVYDKGKELFKFNMKKEFSSIASLFHELYLNIANRVISSSDYKLHEEIVLTHNEQEQLESICLLMHEAGILASPNTNAKK